MRELSVQNLFWWTIMNVRLHRAHVTKLNAYLERETIVRMDWPARSPDLIPIEHAWDILQIAILCQSCATQAFAGAQGCIGC